MKTDNQKFNKLDEIYSQGEDTDQSPSQFEVVCSHSCSSSHANLTNKKPYLGSYDDAPEYMKDNVFILSGYRINFSTYKESLKSAFMFSNNEFSNIWSHFIGIVIAVCLIITVSSFIAQNDAGIIEKTTKELDLIYERYIEHIKVSEDGTASPSSQKQFNSLINSFDENANYVEQIQVFETILQKMTELTEVTPIGNAQKDKLNQVYLSLKAKITTELQTDNLDWVDVYKIFGIGRIDDHIFGIKRRSSDPRQISKWPLIFFLFSSIQCFLGSVLYHTFNAMNQKFHDFLLRLDYAGICFVLLGGSVPFVYYGFYCDSGLLYFYLTLVIFFCSTVFVISLFDFVHSQKYRQFKGILYGSLGIAVSAPLAHLIYRTSYIDGNDTDYLSLSTAYPFYFLSGFSLLGGLCIYLARCPERFKPGKFDRIGNSHNIWHCCVILGIVFGYLYSLENYYTRKQTFCYVK